jgi:hypothetical protein
LQFAIGTGRISGHLLLSRGFAVKSRFALFRRLLPGVSARFFCAIVTMSIWVHAGLVFAQKKGKADPAAAPGEKSYVLPYVIVVLCIALGLLVVCRSGGRSNEPKLDNLE